MADDPPYLTVGTEVSAKYKGAFCEAKIRKVVRVVKCKVTFKAGNGSALLTDDQIKGSLRIGATVEAKHPDKSQFLEANINKIQDCSQYTVVFDDGDITTLRRSALCLKSGRHFNESETLDQLPLTHPEHFSNPVVGGRRGVRRRAADKDESSDEEDDEVPAKTKDGKKKYEKELDMGKVVCVDSADKKKSKDTWFPALVVSPSAQETAKIQIKNEYLVRSFRDGRYYTVPKKEITEFTKDSMSKYDSNSNVLRSAVEKALLFLEKNELPPHWDREVLFGNIRHSESGGEGEDQQSESEVSEDDPRNEEKDRFIAQLYKFMDDRGTPMNKVPQVFQRDLDLHKLFKTVEAKAGYTKVTNQAQWKTVTIKMGYGNMPSTSTINLVKQAYKKYLFSFEEFYRKLGCTWTQRTTSSSSKSRSSRSIFRERITPSSSRESTRDSKKGGDDDDSSTASSSKRGERETKEKPSTPAKDKDSKDDEKEKRSASSPEAASPTPVDTESETPEVKPKEKEPVEEPRKSSRGRQPKKNRDAVEEAASPSSSSTTSASSRKKRQTKASSASRERDRDSSVASSTKDDRPPTPSTSNSAASAVVKKGTGTGRGKYKRHSTKTIVSDAEEKEKEVKEEVKTEEPSETVSTKKMSDIRLGDKLQVYYPKSEGKTYEAKVIDINEKNENFLVHYTGWNNRYDEWIDRARVSENITLKLEQSGEVDIKAAGVPTLLPKESSKGPGAKQRKGRNSSSATSNTSASSSTTTTTTTTTPTTTRSGSMKSNVSTGPPSTPTTGSKRRRSTSSEIVQAIPAPKRRRTRQKSGQDSQTGPAASESEPETSDSDGKSIKSEKVAVEVQESKKTTNLDTATTSPTASNEPKAAASSGKKTEDAEQKPAVDESVKVEKKQPDLMLMDVEDEVSSSSVTSTKSKDAGKSTAVVEDSKESTSSSGSSGQVIDLNQIRLEMKGLEKMVKGGPGSTPGQQPSPTTASSSVSSPAPPTLSAAVASSPAPPEPTKVDIYEFQEDGADDTAPPPITPNAPKLKMFSPAPRSTAATTEKNSPTVAANSAEAVAKLHLSQEQEKTPVPIVAIEKLENPSPSKPGGKTTTVVEPQSESPPPKATVSISPPIVPIKEVIKSTPVTKEIVAVKPVTVSTTTTSSSTTITSPPVTVVATTPPPPPSTSVVSVSLVTPPPPVLTSPAPPPIVVSTPSSAPSLVAVTTASITTPVIISTASKTLSKSGASPKITTIPSTPVVARISLTSVSSPQPSPPILIPSSLLTPAQPIVSTPSVVTLTPVIPSSSVISAISTPATPSTSSPVTSPPPPILLQQQPLRPILSTPPGVRPPVITISSPLTTTASASEKQVLTPIVAATIGPGTIKAIIPSVYTSKKSDIFPHLIQPATATTEGNASSSIPTISIISSTSLKPPGDPSTTEILQPPQIQPAQISAVQQPVKIVATIPPPPPIVIKPTIPTTTATSMAKPMFGPGPVGVTPAPIDTPKQKKKKAKNLGSSITPVKTLAPLPTSGAPPPPPVVVSMSSATTSVASSINIIPTPGRKTPVKKRIPPPMDSPGKPIKSMGIPGMPPKPGKMNSEAMNAAIASVGAATPPTIAVPTTVITSTSTIYQGHSTPGGVIFSTTAGTPPPPPVNISKINQPAPIKSTPESIAASIAAVASFGPTKSTLPVSSKSGMPTKRFMKDSSSDKLGMSKDKIFSGSSIPTPVMSTSQLPPPPPIVIGKATLEPPHPVSQQTTHQPPPPPITIQTKFQPAHSISSSGISSVPAVTFVKATGTGPGAPQTGTHHHVMESHHQHQIHTQSNLPKNPVIFLPSSPVVIKPTFSHTQLQHHTTLQPIIMSKQLQIDGPVSSVSSSLSSSQQASVLVTAAPSMIKSTMLPITVTPSNVQVTSVPVSITPSSIGGGPTLLSTTSVSLHPQPQQHTPAVELKPVTTADLPPSITVTKATTVMKSISPDIVAVSSYNSNMRNTSFTPVKAEERSINKEPEIVVKPAPATAQIVFHTAAESKKVEIVHQQHPPKQVAQQHHHHPTPPPTVILAPTTAKADVNEPEENSLLCEEIIPGSPTTGEDPEDKLDDEEKEIVMKKKSKQEDANKSTKQTLVAETEPVRVLTPPPPVLPPTLPSELPLGSGGKPVIVLEPKFGEDALEEEGFILEERSAKFGDDDDDDNKIMEERSVDSPMGPPSEGREADLPFRDSYSDVGDQSPPSSPSTTSTISTDNSSRRHHTSRLSPTPEGGSSKSKDSDDDDDMDSDVGSKSTHLDDADSKHGSTRGSTRIRNQTSRMGRSPSPPTNKRRRMMNRRNKSPEEARYTPRTIRTSSGRKVTPVGRHGESLSEREEKVKQPPPPPPVNLGKPPKTGRYNFIPNLNGMQDPEQRIVLISQAINDLKDQYQKTKTEAASFDRRVKRWKRRVREKERLARQEATRAAS